MMNSNLFFGFLVVFLLLAVIFLLLVVVVVVLLLLLPGEILECLRRPSLEALRLSSWQTRRSRCAARMTVRAPD
jgi:hypothetical protein